jgi:hypothetical protein
VTVFTPEVGTLPIPSIETLVASTVRHVRTTWSPAEIDAGVAVICAVGGAVAGGAVSVGIGGAGCFFLQPATAMRAASTATGTRMRTNCFKTYLLCGVKRRISDNGTF